MSCDIPPPALRRVPGNVIYGFHIKATLEDFVSVQNFVNAGMAILIIGGNVVDVSLHQDRIIN